MNILPTLRGIATAVTENRLLALMLLFLQFSADGDPATYLNKAVVLIHIGFFLMWQPIWRQNLALFFSDYIIILVVGAASIFALNRGVLAAWIFILIALVSSRQTRALQHEYAAILALLVLLGELLINVVPAAVPNAGLALELATVANWVLLLPTVVIFFLPARLTVPLTEMRIDLLRGLLAGLLVTQLVIGSLLVMYQTQTPYVLALIKTLLAGAFILLLFSWLLAPQRGLQGLRYFWERFLLNLSMPFEQMLQSFSSASQQTSSPALFLDAATRSLTQLNWCAGVIWQTRDQNRLTGEPTAFERIYPSDDVILTLYYKRHPSEALLLHANLLVSIIKHFFRNKKRELELTTQARLEAIYQSGARVTHDIKNLLQSLEVSTALSSRQGADAPADTAHFVDRQLPIITARLRDALAKLHAPRTSRPAARTAVRLVAKILPAARRCPARLPCRHSPQSGDSGGVVQSSRRQSGQQRAPQSPATTGAAGASAARQPRRHGDADGA